jgi:ABC-type Fe3+ transport system permease subunit
MFGLENLVAVMVGPFKSWDDGTCFTASCEGAKLSDHVWHVVANVGYDLLVAAGIITVLVMIWGGIQYMISTGDDGRMTKAKGTLTGGMIGAVISVSAANIVGFLDSAILGSNTPGSQSGDPSGMIKNAFNAIWYIVGAIAVISIIYSGFLYVSARGDESKVKKAKTSLVYAIVGLVVAVSAYAITNFVIGNI